MTDILLCQPGKTLPQLCGELAQHQANQSRSTTSQQYQKQLQLINSHLRINSNGRVNHGDMLVLPERQQHVNPQILNSLLSPDSRRNLAHISSHIGGNTTAALGVVVSKVEPHMADMNTFGGAGMGAAATRASKFLSALASYDQAVYRMEQLRVARAAPETMAKAHSIINQAYIKLQSQFSIEFNRALKEYSSKTIISDIRIGKKIKTLHQTIPIRSTPAAQSLARFGRYAKILGPAAIAADGYFRYDTVMDKYRLGQDWKREAFAQGLGLGTGLAFGITGFMFISGPIGWVLGIILAGAIAIILDRFAVGIGYTIYDQSQMLKFKYGF